MNDVLNDALAKIESLTADVQDLSSAGQKIIDEKVALEFENHRLTAEVTVCRAFVERIAKQLLVAELPDEAEGGDPEGAYDIIVQEARDALDTVSGKQG